MDKKINPLLISSTTLDGEDCLNPGSKPFINPDEIILSKIVKKIATASALFVDTLIGKESNYYIFIKNPNEYKYGGNFIYILKLTVSSEASESAIISVKALFERIANSINFIKPTIF